MMKAAYVVLAASLTLPLSASQSDENGAEASPAQQQTTVRQLAPQEPAEDWTTRSAIPGSRFLPVRPVRPQIRHSQMLVSRSNHQPCLAAEGEDSKLCQFGAAIGRAKPCLAAGDCPAYESWEQVMGVPGIEPAPQARPRAIRWAPPGPPE